MTQTVNISPDTHFLESIRAQKAQFPVLLGEAVDNSFDAGATRIEIVLGGAEISISDNGIGITRERSLGLVRLGQHMPTSMTALGRYGVGIKYQAICAGDVLSVRSRSAEDGQMALLVNWNELIKNGSWDMRSPSWRPEHTSPTGTRVQITALRRSPTAREIEKTQAELAEIFQPALASGASILFNGANVEPVADPLISDPVDVLICVTDEKRARVRAGIMLDPKSRMQGVHISYKHRVLERRSAWACGDFSTAGLFARVELIGNWGLKTFKDGVHDKDEGELEERVHQAILCLLEKCRTQSMSANVAEMRDILNATVPPELKPTVRPVKENNLGRSGMKKKRTGVADNAPESSTGPAIPKSSANGGLVIEFGYEFEEHGYGRYVGGKRPRVFLAQDNPHIAGLLAQRDKTSAARELLAIALMIYLAHQPQAELFDGSFGKRLWSLMAKQSVVFSESYA